MIKIEYQINGKTIETHYKQNMHLAKWFVNNLKYSHKVGNFKFSKV